MLWIVIFLYELFKFQIFYFRQRWGLDEAWKQKGDEHDDEQHWNQIKNFIEILIWVHEHVLHYEYNRIHNEEEEESMIIFGNLGFDSDPIE